MNLPKGKNPLSEQLDLWTQTIKCTCGSHKTYGEDCLAHSEWCDLYDLQTEEDHNETDRTLYLANLIGVRYTISR